MRRVASFLVAALMVAACGAQPVRPALPSTESLTTQALSSRYFSETKLGKRRYKLYTPPGIDSSRPAPLVVMLHGCKQDADVFATGSKR